MVTESHKILIIRRTGSIVFVSGQRGRVNVQIARLSILGACIAHARNKSALVSREPVSVEGRSEQPIAIHYVSSALALENNIRVFVGLASGVA
jgi:hypothetical protein